MTHARAERPPAVTAFRYLALLALHRLMTFMVAVGAAVVLALGAADAYLAALFGTRRVSTLARQIRTLVKEHR
ncbi:hypothetical protein [Acrocarpospora sp. B8E8]|uniref:hypothetical protein n=1 Tax=Acrocarpospora sp. B8E8 TaxID=3153572 RepID=UPI00325D4F62